MEFESRVERNRGPAAPRHDEKPEAPQRRAECRDLVHCGKHARVQRPALLACCAEVRVQIRAKTSDGCVDVRLVEIRLQTVERPDGDELARRVSHRGDEMHPWIQPQRFPEDAQGLSPAPLPGSDLVEWTGGVPDEPAYVRNKRSLEVAERITCVWALIAEEPLSQPGVP